MAIISCQCKLFNIGDWLIVRLPDEVSKQLPTRSQVMVEGTINGVDFQTPLEPDGRMSHWFEIDEKLLSAIAVKSGDTVTLEISPVKYWIEPEIPADILSALKESSQVYTLWQDVTTLARWEWIRWIRSTNNSKTREHRIDVMLSKLRNGSRRPCCWNRNLCTEPAVSKNGVLILEDNENSIKK